MFAEERDVRVDSVASPAGHMGVDGPGQRRVLRRAVDVRSEGWPAPGGSEDPPLRQQPALEKLQMPVEHRLAVMRSSTAAMSYGAAIAATPCPLQDRRHTAAKVRVSAYK